MLRVDIRDLQRGPVETDGRLRPDDPVFEGLELAAGRAGAGGGPAAGQRRRRVTSGGAVRGHGEARVPPLPDRCALGSVDADVGCCVFTQRPRCCGRSRVSIRCPSRGHPDRPGRGRCARSWRWRCRPIVALPGRLCRALPPLRGRPERGTVRSARVRRTSLRTSWQYRSAEPRSPASGCAAATTSAPACATQACPRCGSPQALPHRVCDSCGYYARQEAGRGRGQLSVIRVALDAMGGDHAPQAEIDGCARSPRELPDDFTIQLVGSAEVIEAELARASRRRPEPPRDRRGA